MKPNKFMVVQTISPISFIHPHQFHHPQNIGYLINRREHLQRPSEHLGSLSSGNIDVNVGGKDSVKVDDLYRCLRTFLIFGKVIGLIPISGLFSGDLAQVQFRKCSFSSLICATIIIILTCNTGVALMGYFREGGKDATQLAKNAAGLVCYSMGLFVFVFIFRKSGRFVDLMKKWRQLEGTSFFLDDTSLRRTINIIAGAILTSAITENAVSHLLVFPLHERVEHPLEYYYKNSHKQWAELIPYHPLSAMWVFLCNKWAVYAWNFGDIFVAAISRAIYGKFKGFVKTAEVILLSKGAVKSDWINAIEHHTKLCKLTEEFADLLSPLVFTSFAVNIYFICIQLHHFLAPSKRLDFISALYVTWSFLHLIGRTYTVAITAAKINEYAHQFAKILYDCPRELYSMEVERAERRLATNHVGLHGLATFHIGRPFILSLNSVVFTFEIVLLQTSQMPSPASQDIGTTPRP